jgi:hypothetical protein
MGLAGDEIPEFARVLAVADAFDAMTSTRSYSHARPVPDAIAELRKWAGKQFDPAFVDAFVAAIERDGWRPPQPVGPEPATGPEFAEPAAVTHNVSGTAAASINGSAVNGTTIGANGTTIGANGATIGANGTTIGANGSAVNGSAVTPDIVTTADGQPGPLIIESL